MSRNEEWHLILSELSALKSTHRVVQSMLTSQLTTYHATLWRATAYRPEEQGDQQTSNYPIKRKEKQKTCWELWVCKNSVAIH